MQTVNIQKAEELSADVKSAVESLLGRRLEADEEISVMAFRSHEAPQGAVRQELGERLEKIMDSMVQRTAESSDEEVDEILDEAMRAARPGYRPRK
jgi:hypothetical protein